MRAVLCLVTLFVINAMSVPVSEVPVGGLNSLDLSVTVFNQNNAQSADQSKDYILFAFDSDSCVGEKKKKCDDLEKALYSAAAKKENDPLDKFRSRIVLGKANKDDFPDHKKDLEQAKVPLPAVLFWPAGHSRPSCKFDSANPTAEQVSSWLLQKLKEEEDDDLLQIEEGETPALDATPISEKIDETSLLVCQVNGGPSVVASDEPSCADLMEGHGQGLVQLEKTEKIWDFKSGSTKFLGPADNSLPHGTVNKEGSIMALDAATYKTASQNGNYMALYFTAPWCHYCDCLEPVWNGVSGNLVDTHRQPHLVVGKVNGDDHPELRTLFNVTVYPTFVLVNKQGTKVLGRYLGPRKVFELSSWIEDLIVADENPIVKHQFEKSDEGEHTDMHPVFPYTGSAAFGGVSEKLAPQSLVSLGATLGGNEFDECVDSDEAKFTAPGAALLVHYPSDGAVRSLEMESDQVGTEHIPDKLMVVDFYAPWCSHCQKLSPVWDAVAQKTGDGVVVGKVDMEVHDDIKKQFGIHRFPTIMFFEPGQKMSYDEARRYTGQRDVEHLTQWIEGLKQSRTHKA